MADFLSSLRSASFRGLSFELPQDDHAFGRRVVTHQYPGRDEPFHEDMGSDIDDFSLEAIIQGENFVRAADAFEAALKKAGPGTLIHPHMGQLTVIVKSGRRSHSTDSVGEVRFSITFEKYGGPRFPSNASNSAAGLSLAGDGLFDSILGDFGDRFNLALKPDFITGDALFRVQGFSANIASAFAHGGFGSIASLILPSAWDVRSSDFGLSVISIFKNITSLINPAKKPMVGPATPSAFARSDIPSLVQAMTSVAAPTVPSATASSPTRANNAQSLDYLFRASTLASAAQSARYADYESKDQAIAIRDMMGGQIVTLRNQLGASGWDESWKASGNLLAALTRDINDRVGRLPRTVRIQPQSTRTALDLANRLYGDNPAEIFSRADDLVKRNSIRHPGFIPVKSLEVLV